MMTKILALFITLTLNISAALAQTDNEITVPDGAPVVVELFTSSNCNACMEADRMLYDISKKKNVIVLGCHINYWDENTLSDPTGLEACTYRQWTYRTTGMMTGTEVYVPYFVINGRRSVGRSQIGHFPDQFANEALSEVRRPMQVNMKWKDQKTLYVTLPETNRKLEEKDSFSVWLIRYQDSLVKKLDEGQTAGRVLRFTNVVQDAKHIAKWHGQKRTIEVAVDTPKGGAERGGYAIIIHEVNGSEVIGAGQLKDFKIKKPAKVITPPPVTNPTPAVTPPSK